MTQLPGLRYLNLDIFCFDHREGLGQDGEKLASNREQFLTRIANPPLSDEEIKTFKGRDQNSTRFAYLLPTPYIQAFKEPLDGYYSPAKIGDSYGLQINCSGYRDWATKTCTAQDLQEIHQIIKERHQTPGQLGETWLIWGKLTEACSDDCLTQLAQELLKSVRRDIPSNWNEQQQNQGKWQEATLFELSEIPNQPLPLQQEKPQILIVLFPHHLSDETLLNAVQTQLYPELMQVAYYRSKILWIYHQTREIKQKLKNQAPEIQKTTAIVKSSPQENSNRLDSLQSQLETGFEIYQRYVTWLSYLDEYRYALQVNSDNYQKRFCRFLNIDSPQKGGFFLTFQDYVTEQFIPQVTNDFNTLSVSSALLDNSLKTTEGFIRLEETRVQAAQQEHDREQQQQEIDRDRNLQIVITAIGGGLGVAGVTATAYPYIRPTPEEAVPILPPFSTPRLHPGVESVGVSLGLGVLSAVVVYGVLQFGRTLRGRDRP
ncbi:hypothetical protein [Spirulina major]|uniref:hypothetical protein n=1 Tax=Spirulina major TaxID=270636 RepID=UPI000933A5A3|nr:hypothetical protein [Spirulina major]